MNSPDGGRVLVVEDDDAVRLAVDRGLGVHGFDVSSVPDAESAIAIVARRRPDVMIVDIGLPGMSGVELCTRLRGLDVDTPILILSARDQVGDRVAARVIQSGRLDGVTVEQPIGVLVEFKDGRCVTIWNFFEWHDALKAAGLTE